MFDNSNHIHRNSESFAEGSLHEYFTRRSAKKTRAQTYIEHLNCWRPNCCKI